MSYRLAAQGGYTCHVRLGGRDGGEDVKNTPFDFVAVDDAPFHTLTNAEVEEVEARDEARDEAREAAINIPTRSSTQPGDVRWLLVLWFFFFVFFCFFFFGSVRWSLPFILDRNSEGYSR